MGGFKLERFEPNLLFFKGPTGPTGPPGFQGEGTGGVGPIGPQGSQGSLGVTGIQGPSGIDLPGPQGAAGMEGIIGLFGDVGERGRLGNAGPTGATGQMGTPSLLPNGPPGAQGAIGAQGPIGDGIPGPTGTIEGVVGDVGEMGQFIDSSKSSGMIYRNDVGPGRFETDPSPNYHLIQSRLAGNHDCGMFDIQVWNRPGLSLVNAGTFESEISGQPAGFRINTDFDGIYWFRYNLTIFLDSTNDIDRIVVLECRSNFGGGLISGSRSTVNLDSNKMHVSHNFFYRAQGNENIGIYATNLSGTPNLCINIDNSSFVHKLIKLV
tara:strand:+ start:1327 stop:2292 length:966 start_codon:yes stop_codon:yes gene_type:complete